MFSRSIYLSALTAATTVLAGTNEEGLKFLEENKAREGVVTLPSGLQYKVLKKGKGKYAPTKDSISTAISSGSGKIRCICVAESCRAERRFLCTAVEHDKFFS